MLKGSVRPKAVCLAQVFLGQASCWRCLCQCRQGYLLNRSREQSLRKLPCFRCSDVRQDRYIENLFPDNSLISYPDILAVSIKAWIPACAGMTTLNAIRYTRYARRMTAGGGTRTHTLLPGRDFESRASADSATPALLIYYLLFTIYYLLLK